MKVTANQTAPDFIAQDAYGKTVRLSDYRGKRVFLVFFRVVGCPTCHFTFHEIQKRADSLRGNLVFLAIYQSSPELMRTYLEMEGGNSKIYGTLIADPKGELYQQYEIESSTQKLLSGLLLHGGFEKFSKGNKLYTKKIRDEGHTNRQGAEFLIDEAGKVVIAHYGKFSGDFLSLDVVSDFARKAGNR